MQLNPLIYSSKRAISVISRSRRRRVLIFWVFCDEKRNNEPNYKAQQKCQSIIASPKSKFSPSHLAAHMQSLKQADKGNKQKKATIRNERRIVGAVAVQLSN